jgi:hypothetical protein
MKIFKKLNGAALLFAVLLFTACDKEKAPENSITPAAQPNQKTCRLMKEIYGGSYGAYVYDNSGKVVRIDRFNSDSTYGGGLSYTYNAAGKAAEEIEYNSDRIAESRRVFTYNSHNLLTRADLYSGKSAGGINQLAEYFLFQYNGAGQRILAQHYPGSQSGGPDGYSEYTYIQNGILEMRYNALTMPATITDTVEILFDNKKSVLSALGYLNLHYPEMDKHNIVLIDLGVRYASSDGASSSYNYEYNSLDYPVKLLSNSGTFQSGATFEYDCK